MSRLGSPMMRRGQGAILDEALDGIERALTGDERRATEPPRRDSKWWGWGDPAIAAGARRRGAGGAARADRRAGAVAAGRRARGVRAAEPPSRCRRRCSTRSARSASSPGPRTGVRHATGRGYADLARLRSAALDAAPDAVAAARRRRARCAACSRSAPREGVAVVPFGGGTSVVGGVEPLRGGHERLISLDLAAPARRRGRPPLADRAPRRRPARARGGGGARAAGRHPRPLPAVLRVRDDRRLRRDPLRRARPRAATGASTPWSARSG